MGNMKANLKRLIFFQCILVESSSRHSNEAERCSFLLMANVAKVRVHNETSSSTETHSSLKWKRNENEMKNAWNIFYIYSLSASRKWSIPRCCKWWSAHETRRESSCRSGEKSSYARFALLPTSLTVFMVTAKCWKAFYLRFHNLLSHSSSKTSEIRSIVLFKIECQCDSRSRTSACAPHISSAQCTHNNP